MTVSLVAASLACGVQAASAATLTGDYQFADTRASSCCAAPALSDIGSGNVFIGEDVGGSLRQVLTFPKGNGLSLSSGGVISPDSYSIAVLLRFQETSGFRKIIDFKGASSDSGLYNLSGQLSFFPVVTGASTPPPFEPNKYVQVVLTRDAATKEVIGYVDGAQQLQFTDTNDLGVVGPAATVRFFKDDDAVPNEDSAGAVARIRVYDGPLSSSEVSALDRPRTLADLPPPTLGEEINVQAASGVVRVALPAKGLKFVPLSEARQIPTGSVLDTRRGVVRLASATGAGTKTQSGAFGAGLFQVLQSRSRRARGLTELSLKGASFSSCRTAARGRRASTARSRTIRRLTANARGRFRTRGRNSAATVRGTVWLTTDRCDGTLTKVKRGSVAVRDFRRKRTVVVRAGKSYLARAPR